MLLSNLKQFENVMFGFVATRLIKEFDREVKDLEYSLDSNTNRMLSEKKQSMVHFISATRVGFILKVLSTYCCVNEGYIISLQVKELNTFVTMKKQ